MKVKPLKLMLIYYKIFNAFNANRSDFGIKKNRLPNEISLFSFMSFFCFCTSRDGRSRIAHVLVQASDMPCRVRADTYVRDGTGIPYVRL